MMGFITPAPPLRAAGFSRMVMLRKKSIIWRSFIYPLHDQEVGIKGNSVQPALARFFNFINQFPAEVVYGNKSENTLQLPDLGNASVGNKGTTGLRL